MQLRIRTAGRVSGDLLAASHAGELRTEHRMGGERRLRHSLAYRQFTGEKLQPSLVGFHCLMPAR
jgi:hypothetical protein